jgi:hypothetical protein
MVALEVIKVKKVEKESKKNEPNRGSDCQCGSHGNRKF